MATFFQDSFTGVVNTLLENHTPDTGNAWVKKVAGAGEEPRLNGSGALNGGATAFVTYAADPAPPNGNYFVQIDTGTAGRNRPAVRMSSDGLNHYYVAWDSALGGLYQLFKMVAGSATFISQWASSDLGSVRLVCADNGTSVDLSVYAGAPASALSLIGTFTDTVAANNGGVAPFTSAGLAGLYRFNLSVAMDNFIAGTGTQPGITAGTISVSATPSDLTHVRLTSTASSGGSGTLTYQWHRSTVPGFTPSGGTAISGATSLSLVDTPPTDDVYYYRLRTTDAASTTGDSATFGASYWREPLLIGFAGDSNYFAPPADGTENPPTLIGRHMAKLAGPRAVTISNQAVSATGTTHWQPGQATYNTAAAAFTTALAAAPAGALKDLLFMLGTNNAGSQSQATFAANMTTTVNAFLALGFGRVLLCYQPPIHSLADQTRNQDLLLYQASLVAIAAANPTQVKVIGQDAYELLFAHPEQMNADGIHLLKLGVESLAAIQAADYAAILDPAGVSGGSFAWAS